MHKTLTKAIWSHTMDDLKIERRETRNAKDMPSRNGYRRHSAPIHERHSWCGRRRWTQEPVQNLMIGSLSAPFRLKWIKRYCNLRYCLMLRWENGITFIPFSHSAGNSSDRPVYVTVSPEKAHVNSKNNLNIPLNKAEQFNENKVLGLLCVWCARERTYLTGM